MYSSFVIVSLHLSTITPFIIRGFGYIFRSAHPKKQEQTMQMDDQIIKHGNTPISSRKEEKLVVHGR